MFIYPHINPVAFSLGPVQVHWYGIMYLMAFMSAYLLAQWRVKQYRLDWTTEQIGDLIFYAAVGVILGGRLGYMLFYNTQQLIHHPLSLLKIWQGGMSFHGGLLGVLIAMVFFARKIKKTFWEITDFVVPLVPRGLAFGRWGNFINGELWGRTTTMPWGMVFPQAGDDFIRHPSQLYEFAGEGVLLGILLWLYSRHPRKVGQTSGAFMLGYGIFRFLAEFTREPDRFLGTLSFGLSMGQWLSIPMIVFGLYLILRPSIRKTA